MTRIIYSPKDIFEQEFKTAMRGFDKKEVDEFLDNVIKDYEAYISEIEELKAEIEHLKKKEHMFVTVLMRNVTLQFNRLVLHNLLQISIF